MTIILIRPRSSRASGGGMDPARATTTTRVWSPPPRRRPLPPSRRDVERFGDGERPGAISVGARCSSTCVPARRGRTRRSRRVRRRRHRHRWRRTTTGVGTTSIPMRDAMPLFQTSARWIGGHHGGNDGRGSRLDRLGGEGHRRRGRRSGRCGWAPSSLFVGV
jgi:hypothetical protein